jgi:hypothetical protein
MEILKLRTKKKFYNIGPALQKELKGKREDRLSFKKFWELIRNYIIEGKSAAIFCLRVAARVPDMFCNFCLVKNHKSANASATSKAREKISTHLESLKF